MVVASVTVRREEILDPCENAQSASKNLEQYRSGKDVSVYDPEKALKSIAVAEAVENHCRLVHDGEGLYYAIEEKLTRQRRFIIWYDEQPKDKGGGDVRNTADRVVSGEIVTVSKIFHIPETDKKGINAKEAMLSRWRKTLKSDKDYEKTLKKVQEQCLRYCEQSNTPTGGFSNNEDDECYTPEEYIEAARRTMGSIDLDPASNDDAQDIVQADVYYTKEDSAFQNKIWEGNTWLNPPYSKGLINDFVERLIHGYEKDQTVTQAIVLTSNHSETRWFQSLVAKAGAICFTSERLVFWHPDGEKKVRFGSVIFYFGHNPSKFKAEFTKFGEVIILLREADAPAVD